MVLICPDQLDGYSLIWRISTEGTIKTVIDCATKLLVQMHHETSPELVSMIPKFDDIFIS